MLHSIEKDNNNNNNLNKISTETLSACTLCPRECKVNRFEKIGYCGMPATVFGARAALHLWEEPCITGKNGSGTVFFTGCTLRCVFCQNHNIANGSVGKEITIEHLSTIFLSLQEQGATNINLVTPTHYVPQIIEALKLAKKDGLTLPIVYNTSGYEKVSTLKLLEGYVDVYLPDFKYMDKNLALRYSNAKDYPNIAKKAIKEMVRQVGEPVFEHDKMKRGVIVRHLVLPGHRTDSKKVLQYLYETYHDTIFLSIMNQFTPLAGLSDYPEINRKVTKREYNDVIDFAIELGITNAFIQEGQTASESFIPAFSLEGI
jgi:putative pyruvate formate lyase activating enzyme